MLCVPFRFQEIVHHIIEKKKEKKEEGCTFNASWFLCDADPSFWNHWFTLRIADVSWDER